jgi:hypothetical protein
MLPQAGSSGGIWQAPAAEHCWHGLVHARSQQTLPAQ